MSDNDTDKPIYEYSKQSCTMFIVYIQNHYPTLQNTKTQSYSSQQNLFNFQPLIPLKIPSTLQLTFYVPWLQ